MGMFRAGVRNHRIQRRVKGAFRWPACTHRYEVYSIECMFRLSDPFIYNCLDAVGSVRCPENVACVRARCLLIIARFSFKQNASLVIQFFLGLPLFIPDLATTCPSFHARWMFCCLFALHFLIRLSDAPPRGDNGLPDKRVSSTVMPEVAAMLYSRQSRVASPLLAADYMTLRPRGTASSHQMSPS